MRTINNNQQQQYILPRNNGNHEMNFDMSILKNYQVINNIVNSNSNVINYFPDENKKCNGTIYNLVTTQININDVSDFTYGICVQQGGQIIDYALGLSKDYEKIKSFVNLCNKNTLSVAHFRDVIDDILEAI